MAFKKNYFIFWHNTAKKRNDFEFKVIASETEDAKVTCTTSSEASVVLQVHVERCHKITARTRKKVSN